MLADNKKTWFSFGIAPLGFTVPPLPQGLDNGPNK